MILGEGPIGEQIRQWRTNLGLSIAEAARGAGISGSVWGRVEDGSTPTPLWSTVAKMFHGMGAKIEATALPREAAWRQEPLPVPATPKKPDTRVHADA